MTFDWNIFWTVLLTTPVVILIVWFYGLMAIGILGKISGDMRFRGH